MGLRGVFYFMGNLCVDGLRLKEAAPSWKRSSPHGEHNAGACNLLGRRRSDRGGLRRKMAISVLNPRLESGKLQAKQHLESARLAEILLVVFPN